MRIGTAQWDSTKYPKTKLPKIAPSLAATSVRAMAVDLREVGNSSIPRQSKLLNPIVDTAPNMQDRMRFMVELLTR